jgi:hypothetical protein
VENDDLLYGQGDLQDKCKFRCGDVVYCGDKDGALEFMVNAGCDMSGAVGFTATAGDGGTATAGDGGTVLIKYWDGSRCRIGIGYVGEGLIANKKYQCNNDGKFIEK